MADAVYLLDTNICIYLLEGLSESARRRVEAAEVGTVITSAIVFAEVMVGFNENDLAAIAHINALFTVVPIVPFDERAAKAYGRLPFRRARFDRLIAAHALALDATLVTNDTADFAEIAGLKLENWAQ